jgi:hypothetical protein
MLPSSRNTTYVASSPVKSADLNAIQDCIVGMKYPTRTVWFPPLSRTANDITVTFTNGMYFASANNGSINYVAAPIGEGDRVTRLRANVKGTGGAGNVQVVLTRWKDGVQTTVGTLTIVNPPNAWANYDAAIGPFVVAAGEAYWLNCVFALQNQGISAFGLDSDRL